ncbi:hypothetical protein, partial [Desulfofundulus thermobenzoicus]|uniref:hypothetical protein n=1 Tax=Desulfofundulus thermobenzoicus TaxID=29376 RepID=UPI001A9B5E26
MPFYEEYFCWYLFCCSMDLPVGCPFQPIFATFVPGIDVSKWPVGCKIALHVLDQGFNPAFAFRVAGPAEPDFETHGLFEAL